MATRGRSKPAWANKRSATTSVFSVCRDHKYEVAAGEEVLFDVPDDVALSCLDFDCDAFASSGGEHVDTSVGAWCFDSGVVAVVAVVLGVPVLPVGVCE